MKIRNRIFERKVRGAFFIEVWDVYVRSHYLEDDIVKTSTLQIQCKGARGRSGSSRLLSSKLALLNDVAMDMLNLRY